MHDDGDVRIPARSAAHAVQLCEAMILASSEGHGGSSKQPLAAATDAAREATKRMLGAR